MPDRGAPRGDWAPAGTGGRAGRWSLRLAAHLSPELDHLFLKVDHSLGAHGCQSNEFHDYRPYPAVAGKGFVELGEPLEEFPSDNGFVIELYAPHFAERREVGCFFGMGLHLSSVGRVEPPVRIELLNGSWSGRRTGRELGNDMRSNSVRLPGFVPRCAQNVPSQAPDSQRNARPP
jgi:hypothetical protein